MRIDTCKILAFLDRVDLRYNFPKDALVHQNFGFVQCQCVDILIRSKVPCNVSYSSDEEDHKNPQL